MHALILMYQVSSELQLHADRSPGLLVSIVEARRRLAGMETSDLLRCVCVHVCVSLVLTEILISTTHCHTVCLTMTYWKEQ